MVTELAPVVEPAASVRRQGGRGNRLATPPSPYERRKLPNDLRRVRRPKFWRDMFLACVRKAVADGELSPGAARGLGRIADHAGPTCKVSWPSLAVIGAGEQRSGRTAADWTREAEARGWLVKEHRAKCTAGRWMGQSNLYVLMVPGAYADWWAELVSAKKGRPTRPRPPSPPRPPAPAQALPAAASAEEPREQLLDDAPRSLADVRKLVSSAGVPPRRRRGPP